MGTVQVSGEGLQTEAALCASVSAELVNGIPKHTPGPPGQATSDAVIAGYAAIETTAQMLAARVQATGSKLGTASDDYATQDDRSAQRIAATGQSIAI